MMTQQALDKLPLVKDVNVAVGMFLHDWEIAATQAIGTFEVQKDDDNSNLNFWIAFAGNMVWAVTIFVAPEVALVGEAATLAEKAMIVERNAMAARHV